MLPWHPFQKELLTEQGGNDKMGAEQERSWDSSQKLPNLHNWMARGTLWPSPALKCWLFNLRVHYNNHHSISHKWIPWQWVTRNLKWEMYLPMGPFWAAFALACSRAFFSSFNFCFCAKSSWGTKEERFIKPVNDFIKRLQVAGLQLYRPLYAA